MQVINEGSVRVDLVGGTLDIEPINLILKNVVTLNVATSLKAKVQLSETSLNGVEIISSDYNKNYFFPQNELTDENVLYSNQFGEMTFVLQILRLFNIDSHLKIELSSGAPAGSGLGGSSAMGVTLYKALCSFTQQGFSRDEAVLKVKAVESRILNQGVAGYQDYFPALTGGILAIKGREGKIDVEQLYSKELKEVLEKKLTLIYSGQSRASGINNWEVYKSFFDRKPEVVEGLQKIASISNDTYLAIKNKNWDLVLNLIADEGKERERLFPGIMTDKIRSFVSEVSNLGNIFGVKMCGAGGGGCFILVHGELNKDQLAETVKSFEMKILPFEIDRPIE